MSNTPQPMDYVFTIRTQDDVTRQYVINMITNMSSAEKFTLHGKEYNITLDTNPFVLINKLNKLGRLDPKSRKSNSISLSIPI